MEKIKRDTEFFNTSKQVEEKLAELAVHAYKLGFNRIVVAGGETSGAVTSALGFTSFSIGKEIAPGVPTLIPTINSNFHLILKSGNFGNKDFFLKVLED